MFKNFEIRIYGVQFYFDNHDVELDNEEITYLSDKAFINRAEEEGNVWTIGGFLRALEEINYGCGNVEIQDLLSGRHISNGKYDEQFYNMTLRAYLINLDNTDDVIRIDMPDQYIQGVTTGNISEVR